ncbi:Hypothetical predicted protein [Cloeon dipterum]|uniref:Uncharacterized protein n=1 Tax=Cloeon dipterum TaxID=197152 RepID=A0A8S1CHY9_9INSE|nr:Hypothetical predicted protein [Cloeon dipterum]
MMQPTSSVHIVVKIKMLKIFFNFLLQETGSYIKIPNSTTKFPHECGVQLGLKRDICVDPIGRRWNSPLLKENKKRSQDESSRLR